MPGDGLLTLQTIAGALRPDGATEYVGPMRPDELVLAGEFLSPQHAEIARARLAAAGITALVQADDAGGMYPGVALGRVRLLVKAEDLPAAQQLLAEGG